jgi:hypothetical protein
MRLSRGEEAWKTAEILLLRHQLSVLQRQQPRCPRLNWAGRALLATLLAVIPKGRRLGLRLLITPDTIMRWHRDIVRRKRKGDEREKVAAPKSESQNAARLSPGKPPAKSRARVFMPGEDMDTAVFPCPPGEG